MWARKTSVRRVAESRTWGGPVSMFCVKAHQNWFAPECLLAVNMQLQLLSFELLDNLFNFCKCGLELTAAAESYSSKFQIFYCTAVFIIACTTFTTGDVFTGVSSSQLGMFLLEFPFTVVFLKPTLPHFRAAVENP
jgi:hypothetical protein